LKTVVNKLFEFMHEKFEGVQDMACDTFLKICVKCRRRFVMLQIGEAEPFVCDLLRNIPAHTADLESLQINTFYEAVGLMVSAEPDTARAGEYLQQLMSLPNLKWQEIMAMARQNTMSLREAEPARKLANILATNTSVCTSMRGTFQKQLGLIFNDVLAVYKTYSELCSSVISTDGPVAAKRSDVKLMRSVKRQALRLLETFLDKADASDLKVVGIGFVQTMLDPVLGDYSRSVADARDAEVLSLFAVVVSRFGSTVESEIAAIFDACFQTTLSMITKNYEEYPDHRIKFYSLLRAVVQHCFRAICALSPEQISLLIDSIVWAFRHTERNVADLGLNLLLELLKSIQQSAFVNPFYQKHCVQLIQEIVAAMTDTFHKPGFKLHVLIMQHLFSVVGDPTVLTCPIWDSASQKQFPSNEHYVREHLTGLLVSSFPNMSQIQVQAVVSGMFDLRKDYAAFKSHLRDFLVQTKEFATTDNAELYAEETASQAENETQRLSHIPGMVKPEQVTLDDGQMNM
jgi:exportin-1